MFLFIIRNLSITELDDKRRAIVLNGCQRTYDRDETVQADSIYRFRVWLPFIIKNGSLLHHHVLGILLEARYLDLRIWSVRFQNLAQLVLLNLMGMVQAPDGSFLQFIALQLIFSIELGHSFLSDLFINIFRNRLFFNLSNYIYRICVLSFFITFDNREKLFRCLYSWKVFLGATLLQVYVKLV